MTRTVSRRRHRLERDGNLYCGLVEEFEKPLPKGWSRMTFEFDTAQVFWIVYLVLAVLVAGAMVWAVLR